ncbi:MAG: peptidoglycan bridge formation glycyltransferase FemA/FemB family protein [Bacteroidia bacterium]|nr:peptidoglycan bridge formation glycyltransferase FemA/FemB family protein [Bacteroidia bacterium]
MIRNLAYKEINQVYSTPILQQTAFWSKVKENQGMSSIALNFRARKRELIVDGDQESGYLDSDILILLRKIDSRHSIAYVPYGPEVEPKDEKTGEFLEDLSEQLRSFLPKDCIMIRYDLAWRSLWASDTDYFDHEGNWLGPPERRLQELRFNIDTQHWNFRKAHSNILPANTVFLDLNRSEESILDRMKPKTRYNISLSYRNGVEITECGTESLGVWYELYRETALRNSFYLHSEEYFRIILEEKANDTESPAQVILLIARHNGLPLAAMFLVISDTRATYLYGASSSSKRNLMATYALQWRAISIARERGCVDYDMFGVAPYNDSSHPMHGLYRFKTGFGGEMHHAMGCWDYPLNEDLYSYFTAMEMNQQGYHV